MGSYGDKCFYWRELSIPVVTVCYGFLRLFYVLVGHILGTRKGYILGDYFYFLLFKNIRIASKINGSKRTIQPMIGPKKALFRMGIFFKLVNTIVGIVE